MPLRSALTAALLLLGALRVGTAAQDGFSSGLGGMEGMMALGAAMAGQGGVSRHLPSELWIPLLRHWQDFKNESAKAKEEMGALSEIHKRWPEAADLRPVAVDWDGRRTRLEGSLKRITSILAAYNGSRKLAASRAMRSMNEAGTAGAQRSVVESWLQSHRKAQTDMEAEALALKDFLRRDEARRRQFDAAAAARARNRVMLLAGAPAAGLAALLGFLFWRKRRPPPPDAVSRPLLSMPAGKLLDGKGELTPGQMFANNYRVEKQLGHGGMGVVYEATDTTLQRKVAIKRMREELLRSARELEMFLSEARLVATLRHPNIVEIYSVVKEAEEVFLIFEHVQGWSLDKVLDKKGLSYAQARSITQQVARGLDAAHAKKVIHRDLKPSNVIVTSSGVAKVMDFGIAHQAKKTVAQLTRATSWGTPPYMAPEQELGSVSRESDVYALGVCLYEMLSGRLPFQGPNFLAQKNGMLFEPVSKLVPGLPAGLDAVFSRVLAVDPKDRYHSGAELADSLPKPL